MKLFKFNKLAKYQSDSTYIAASREIYTHLQAKQNPRITFVSNFTYEQAVAIDVENLTSKLLTQYPTKLSITFDPNSNNVEFCTTEIKILNDIIVKYLSDYNI